MNSDDEIILSHMFDRIMERFDKLESRMDANDRRLVKPRFRSPQELDHEDQPRTRNNSCWGPPPGRSHQGYSYQHPTRLRSCHKQPLDWPPPALRPSSSWYLQGLHLTQSLQPATSPNSCWVPPRVQLEQPTHQPLRPPVCWDYRVQQESQAYDQQHPTGPLEYQASDFAAIAGGDSESVYYTNDYWDSVDSEEDVDASLMRQPVEDKTWVPANEIAYPSDNVKGKGQVSNPATTSRFHPWQRGNCPTPCAADSRRLSRPHLLHDPSSSSLPAALAVPPPPLQRSPSCCPTSSASPLPAAAAAAVPSVNWSPPAPPCSPDSSVEEDELLDDHGASNLDVAGVSNPSIALLCANHGVEEDRDASPESHQVSSLGDIYLPCSSDETTIISTTPLPAVVFLPIEGDSRFLLQEIAYDEGGVCLRIGTPLVQEYIGKILVYVADVCGTLGAYSSFRPKRITSGRVMDQEFDYEENLGLLQLDLHVPDAEVCEWRRSPFDDHISPPLLIFYGGDEGRSSVVRHAFDPGGDVSPKLLLSTLVVGSWFPP